MVLQGWQLNSQGLSQIELLWAVVKRIVSFLNPQRFAQLRDALTNALDGIPHDTIDKLSRSFKARLMLCRDRGKASRMIFGRYLTANASVNATCNMKTTPMNGVQKGTPKLRNFIFS
jgi:hypothetical protein